MTSKLQDRNATQSRLDELRDELAEVDEKRAAIKGQIEKAQHDRHVTGEYADSDWYRRAKGALRHLGIERADICREIGEVSREVRALNDQVNRNTFHRAVRDIVDDPTWALIVHRHEQLKDEEN
jgi:chromosome segregation ATPase